MDILNVEKLTNEKWLNLFSATYHYNGKTGRWVFASRKSNPRDNEHKADAVVIVPILHQEGHPPRLVMIREFRIPVGAWMYGLPAGILEAEESIEEAVRRELLEETAFELVRVKRISPPIYSSAGMTDESAVLVFVDVRAEPERKQQLESSEAIEVCLLDYEQVCNLCNSHNRFDAKAWIVLAKFQQMGRLE